MTAELDLTTAVEDILRRGSNTLARATCAVKGFSRIDCCNRNDVHFAEAFLRFKCGCAYTYCRHALVVIYGRRRLTGGVCVRHGEQPIIEGYWL